MTKGNGEGRTSPSTFFSAPAVGVPSEQDKEKFLGVCTFVHKGARSCFLDVEKVWLLIAKCEGPSCLFWCVDLPENSVRFSTFSVSCVQDKTLGEPVPNVIWYNRLYQFFWICPNHVILEALKG
ncbi:hypothetical protein BFR35_11750 [Brochothrix thermosphacta]|nr:hypothetical protein BFR35_11750 [Brochothrix thermosphacta]